MNETGVRCWRRGQWPYGPAMNDMASKKSYLALHLIFSPLILSPSNYVRMINWPARLSSSYPKMVCWKGSCYHPKWSSVSAYDSHFLHCMSDCLEVDETIRSRSTEHEVSLLPQVILVPLGFGHSAIVSDPSASTSGLSQWRPNFELLLFFYTDIFCYSDNAYRDTPLTVTVLVNPMLPKSVTVSKYLLTVTLFLCPVGVTVTEDICSQKCQNRITGWSTTSQTRFRLTQIWDGELSYYAQVLSHFCQNHTGSRQTRPTGRQGP